MPELQDCTGACRKAGNCDCGAIIDGVLQDGRTMRVSLMLNDSAQPGLGTMTTDAQTRTIDQAAVDAEAAKPEYAIFRGLSARDGAPLDQHYARLNLIRGGGAARLEAAHDHMAYNLERAHQQQPPISRQPNIPQFAKDGRPMATLTDTERAREAMMTEMSNAWQR